MVTPHRLHLLQLPSSLNTATLKAKSPIYEPLAGKPYQNVHTSYEAVLAKVLLGELKDLSKDFGEDQELGKKWGQNGRGCGLQTQVSGMYWMLSHGVRSAH